MDICKGNVYIRDDTVLPVQRTVLSEALEFAPSAGLCGPEMQDVKRPLITIGNPWGYTINSGLGECLGRTSANDLVARLIAT